MLFVKRIPKERKGEKMSRNITITEGLNELKLYDSKITKAIFNASFVNTGKKSSDKLGSITKDEFIKQSKANYQSITDLIANRDKLKRAIVYSNAITEVTINGETMTVASAIEKKNSIGYLKNLLNTMESDYSSATRLMQKNNEKMEAQIDKMLEGFVGKDSDKKVQKEDLENIANTYRNANEFELVDPLNINDKITELNDYISGFEGAVDTALSISNSNTYIEIA